MEKTNDGGRYLSSKSEHNSSNLARVRVVSMCLGPSAVAVINGRLGIEFIPIRNHMLVKVYISKKILGEKK